ncbi:retrotransposable element [Pimephales promelas]|nr:retrotransposable element [Pimephales promelas]
MEVDEHTSPSNVEHVLTELSSQAATINKHEQILTEILHLKPLQSHHLSSYLKLLQSYQPSLKVPLSQVHQQPNSFPTGSSRVAYMTTLLVGKVLDWATAFWERQSPLMTNLFISEMRNAYNLVRIRAGDEWKTAFNTQTGHYEFKIVSSMSGRGRYLQWQHSDGSWQDQCSPELDPAVLCQTELPFVVEVDVSDVGVGGVLSQKATGESKLHPCSFVSCQLTPAKKNYDIGNGELLTVKLAVREWRNWMEGAKHPFIIWTNHKNLTYIRSKNSKPDALLRQFDMPGVEDRPEPNIIAGSKVVAGVLWGIDGDMHLFLRVTLDLQEAYPDRVLVAYYAGNTVILVVVDRFSKACYLIPLPKIPTACQTADLMKSTGSTVFPQVMVSDWGSRFTSRFWKVFGRLIGASIRLSSGFHPQSNGTGSPGTSRYPTSLEVSPGLAESMYSLSESIATAAETGNRYAMVRGQEAPLTQVAPPAVDSLVRTARVPPVFFPSQSNDYSCTVCPEIKEKRPAFELSEPPSLLLLLHMDLLQSVFPSRPQVKK